MLHFTRVSEGVVYVRISCCLELAMWLVVAQLVVTLVIQGP